MGIVDDVQALIEKVRGTRTKAASLATLTAGFREKYRNALASATNLADARAKIAALDVELGAHDAEIAEAVAANTDANDNGIPDRDEVAPPASEPTPDPEPVEPS